MWSERRKIHIKIILSINTFTLMKFLFKVLINDEILQQIWPTTVFQIPNIVHIKANTDSDADHMTLDACLRTHDLSFLLLFGIYLNITK